MIKQVDNDILKAALSWPDFLYSNKFHQFYLLSFVQIEVGTMSFERKTKGNKEFRNLQVKK